MTSASDSEIDAAFETIASQWDRIDFLVHAIAYSDRNELKGRYVQTTRENFVSTMSISCYSFTAVARRCAPLMGDGGALLTLTFGGASRVMPNYNVMGLAKAALEAERPLSCRRSRQGWNPRQRDLGGSDANACRRGRW